MSAVQAATCSWRRRHSRSPAYRPGRAGAGRGKDQFLRPAGRVEVRASALRPVSALISEDLPTLERPAKAISGPAIAGSEASDDAADTKFNSPGEQSAAGLDLGLGEIVQVEQVTTRARPVEPDPGFGCLDAGVPAERDQGWECSALRIINVARLVVPSFRLCGAHGSACRIIGCDAALAASLGKSGSC